jgi:hypothetical protein
VTWQKQAKRVSNIYIEESSWSFEQNSYPIVPKTKETMQIQGQIK